MPENLKNRQTTSYGVTRTIRRNSGLMMIPAAGPPGTPAIFVRVAAPSEYEIVTWSAEAENGLPVIPSPYGPTSPTDPTPNPLGLNANRVLVHESPVVTIPVPLGTGGHKFVSTGTYVYGAYQPSKGGSQMRTGKWPYENHKVTDNYYPESAFSMDVIDPTMVPTEYPVPGVLDAPLNQGP